MPSYIEVCEQAARAGAVVLKDWIGRFRVHEKGPADLVTEADIAAQDAVTTVIRSAFPDHDVLGEEDQQVVERCSDYRWIIDPLDGTTNYVHGVPHYAVSVALEHRGKLTAGVVLDPSADECFWAAAGEGAYLNSKRLKTSSTEQLSDALVAASFPPAVTLESREIGEFCQVLVRSRAVRRTGSAALNLAYIAAGRFDAYWARETKSWDVAAGALLVAEAGGIITGLDGEKFEVDRPRFLATGSFALHREMLAFVGEM